MLWQSARR
ncbi:Protein of unknown function [Propionibacterium freudenreichii subsp. freudenreichii]|uniref:Uncharacterized protein n=1 Tax=Propionibacterium freudenreichii subsp. freudenreichii TaxID=66712 RepID=A0A0B7NST0_PROFF|nr:Protein of unknown function [Propionibacterium freudenreichii subsp. freudenreichii]